MKRPSTAKPGFEHEACQALEEMGYRKLYNLSGGMMRWLEDAGSPPPVGWPEMSRLLVIGGSDSSGGAGVFADLKTCHDLGCEVSVAITAVTAQSDRRHYHSHVLSEEALQSQLLALGDFGIDAVKIGMLPGLSPSKWFVIFLLAHSFVRVVLDPVFSSSSGGSLSTEEGFASLSKLLFPHVGLITPNFSEASRLIKQAGLRSESQEAMAAACLELGPKAVLVKGGHCSGEECVDFLATDDGERLPFPESVSWGDRRSGGRVAG